jgi:hypothetical protein
MRICAVGRTNSAAIEEKRYDFQEDGFTSMQKGLRLGGLEIDADPGMVGVTH